MEVERLNPSDVALEVVEALGSDPAAASLNSTPVLAASVHRAASVLCPTTPGILARAVAAALSGLPGLPSEARRAAIDSTVEALTALGDLIELPVDDGEGRRRRQIYLGPPSYLVRDCDCILLGVRPDGAPIVSDALLGRVEYRGHLRLMRPDEGENLDATLAGDGLVELAPEQWLYAPRQCAPKELLDQYIARLDAAGEAGELEGVRVIDPSADVAYYSGRWRVLKPTDQGRFLARRPQAFGADLWCFAEVLDGNVAKLIDLPVSSPAARGSDEAWRLQAALDRLSGGPQRLRIRRGLPDGPVVDLFSPLPSWSQRRLELVAMPADRSRGALFSYALTEAAVGKEVRFLREMMWLAVEEVTSEEHG